MKIFLTAGDKDRFLRKLLDTLKIGHKNAITSAEMARRIGAEDERKVRLLIRQLIKEGVPVASAVVAPFGYYVAANQYEAHEYIKTLQNRIDEDTARLADFSGACAKYNFEIPQQAQLKI